MTVDRPLIGISCCLDRGRIHRPGADYLYLNRAYPRAVERAGADPVLLPVRTVWTGLERLDGVIVTGGGDIDPARYGRAVEKDDNLEEPERIDSDLELLRAAGRSGIPALGICYGHQLINVLHGGTLIQRLPQAPVDHGRAGSRSPHPVTVGSGSLLADALGGRGSLVVASSHRQAVDTLGQGLTVSARAADGVVEAIERPGGPPLIGVQWHPESMEDDGGLLGWFVGRCAGR